MTTSANAKVVVGFRNAQFIEEDVRHVFVIMLASMQHYLGKLTTALECSGHHGRFDELRPSPDDRNDSLQGVTSY